jgi:hypothetical protein
LAAGGVRRCPPAALSPAPPRATRARAPDRNSQACEVARVSPAAGQRGAVRSGRAVRGRDRRSTHASPRPSRRPARVSCVGEVPHASTAPTGRPFAFVDDGNRPELRRPAARWAIERGWSSTVAIGDWLLREHPEPRLVGVWARYLRELREPTVLEMHVQEWLSPFWLTTSRPAARRAFHAVLRDLQPKPNQTWRAKGRQTVRALAHPRRTRTEHYVRSGYQRTATGQWKRPS